jgi:hypothetical protein
VKEWPSELSDLACLLYELAEGRRIMASMADAGQMLQYLVGAGAGCPHCQAILDWRWPEYTWEFMEISPAWKN